MPNFMPCRVNTFFMSVCKIESCAQYLTWYPKWLNNFTAPCLLQRQSRAQTLRQQSGSVHPSGPWDRHDYNWVRTRQTITVLLLLYKLKAETSLNWFPICCLLGGEGVLLSVWSMSTWKALSLKALSQLCFTEKKGKRCKTARIRQNPDIW